jgi:RNA polymerase sigma-70 factor, ECF subfamily
MMTKITAAERREEAALPAVAELFGRYNPLVLRTAYLVLGDWTQAEDVAQEVWMQVARHLPAYDPRRGAWTTWLHHITVNRCLNLRRRLRRWVRAPLAPGLPDRAPPPLEAVLHTEAQRRVWAAVGRLPIKLRVAVVLRYYHDLSYAEIAAALDCPVGTVRSRLHAAHARLRAALAEIPDAEGAER